MDDIQNLGIDVLYMTPIFQSNSCHKYDTTDYYQIDPSFGTTEDLKELVQKAHERGMKVVLDAVYNHTGREFLRLRIFWKMVKNPNTGTGILLMDSHLKANGERSQTSNVLVIMAECQS